VGVTRQQGDIEHGGVGPDEEIRQDAPPRPATAAVSHEGPGGEKKRRTGNLAELEADGLDGRVEPFERVVGRRYLGVDHGIDENWAATRPLVQRCQRPAAPLWVRRDDVEQDVAVGEDQLRPGSRASSS